jgi:hypothetical protein
LSRPALRTFDLSLFLSYCSKLFCTHKKLNSFLFKQFRTLCAKHPGGGDASSISTFQPSSVQPANGPCLPVTCPEDVHLTYYWSERFARANFLRATFLRFPQRGRV